MSKSKTSALRNVGIWLVALFGLAVGVGVLVRQMQISSSRTSSMGNRPRFCIQIIDTAVRYYEVMSGALPASLEQLCVGTEEIPAPLKRDYLVDPWGKSFRYRITSKTAFEIRSSGPDMIMDTLDDLTN